MRKFLVVIIALCFLILASAGIYFYLIKKQPSQISLKNQQKITHQPCLEDGEEASFQYIGVRLTATSSDIIISDKITGKEKFRFQVDNLSPNSGYPYEFRKCGIYIAREFNWDHKRSKPLPGFSEELWKYTYDGKGEKILVFGNNNRIFYDFAFRTDFSENYIALVAGSLERIKEYAVVIKEIPTNKDVFSLGYQRIIDKHPDLTGFFNLGAWTKDSRYFWGRLHVGASVTAFFRIEQGSWEVKTFLPPEKTAGGTAFNPEYGHLTYDTGPGWIGIEEIAQQVFDEWRKAGKIAELHLYNLFTKDDILLATSTEPSWSGNPQWISNTELEYYLPSGERKIYVIK